MNSHARPHALVLCVGNSLAGDDAAGCAVYERLAAAPCEENVRLHLLGLGGIALLDLLSGEDLLIVVDAVRFGASPGTLHVRSWESLPARPGHAISLHGIGLQETLEIAQLLYPETLPRQAYLVGIEGERFDELGVDLTPAVAAAVPLAAHLVRELICRQLEPALQCNDGMLAVAVGD